MSHLPGCVKDQWTLTTYRAKSRLMPMSLKSFLPVVSRIVGESTDALYERQRALVREGLLVALPGHGRGSGVRADADSVAMLLIALMSTVNLSNAGARSRDLSEAPHESGKCGLTGERTFRAALSRILSDAKLAKRVKELRVVTNGAMAQVTHGTKREFFVKDFTTPNEHEGLSIDLTLRGDVISRLAAATIEMIEDQGDVA